MAFLYFPHHPPSSSMVSTDDEHLQSPATTHVNGSDLSRVRLWRASGIDFMRKSQRLLFYLYMLSASGAQKCANFTSSPGDCSEH